MGSHHLSQRYTLPLSARDAADELVADFGLGCVANTKGAEDIVLRVLHVVLLLLQVLFPLPRDLAPQGEFDGLIDRQDRKVDIIWDLVNHLSVGYRPKARTLGVERDLLAVPPCPLTVHIAVPHFTFNLVE
jgi:hypothetical protein